MTPPEPPFVVGQRIRCRVDTLAAGRSTRFDREQLYGRAGTITGVERNPWHGHWDVRVKYDHLTGPSTGWRSDMLHRPEELVAIEDWA